MAYFDKYGVEFSYDRKTLVKCPKDFLGAYVIPDSVTSIIDWAFQNCSGLKSVTIPNSVTSIENLAFEGCSGLTIINVSNDNPNYSAKDGVLFNKQLTTLIKYPNGKQGAYAIPNSVTTIGSSAFSGCSGLTAVTIPNSVTSIGNGAFWNCKSLTSVTIPNSVTSIGGHAFYGCSGLTSIIVENGNSFYDSRNNCNAIIETATNTLIVGCKNTIIPNSVTSIEKDAFYNCSSLTSVTIPNSVTSIGSSAFEKCTALTSVTIPDSITNIGNWAFYNCSGLREIIVPLGQKARFLQMGLKEYTDIIVERDNEELTILLNLAKAYELGIGVAKNMAQSVLYYTQAAEKGSAEAAYRLAEWYQNGEVLPLDLNKALDLYQQAAKSGYKDAEEKAQRIQQKIEAEEKKQADYLAEKQKEQETKAVVEAQAIPYYLFFDTETAGLPPKGKYDVPVTNPDFWPRLVQLAWILTDKEGKVLNRKSKIIYPNGFSIPASATAVHHITTEHAMQVGEPLRDVLGEFMRDLLKAEKIVCHNVKFDQHIVGAELYSMDMDYKTLMDKPSICTKLVSTNFCALPNTKGHSGYKWPSLPELYQILFGRDFENAHDALADITATKDCFFELKRRGIIKE